MNYTSIDGKQFMNMILAGVNKLNADKASIDSLNVFPVPDGDTGTNMSLTLNSVARFLGQIPETEITVAKVAEQMSYGALMGARGNSGVILSQILGGLAKVFTTKGDTASAKDFVEGFASGQESAYKAVVKPMEGTILTVCREASEYLSAVYQDSFTIEDCLNAYLEEGYRSLQESDSIRPQTRRPPYFQEARGDKRSSNNHSPPQKSYADECRSFYHFLHQKPQRLQVVPF